MKSRDRINCILNHEEADSVPIHDSPWVAAIERWHEEGLPRDADINEYFGYEMRFVLPDFSPQFKHEIIDEDDKYVIERNEFGTIVKNYRDHSTTPQFIESPVKNREEWEKLKERLVINDSRLTIYDTFDEMEYPGARKKTTWEETLEKHRKEYEKGHYFCFCGWLGYDMLQHYLGVEKLLMVLVDDPEWAKDMFNTVAEFLIRLHGFLEENGVICDGAFIGSDMGYRNTSLFSPQHYKELFMGADKMLCDYFHGKDMKVILHCDGNINNLVPFIIESGFDCLQPIEAKAGMDLINLKSLYGDKLSFMGGIDVGKMADPVKIEEEIASKVPIAKKGGGYIYHSDHSVPNNISLQQYINVLELIKKYGKY
ncbi:MAG: uroporphyrinogen decarboxylase family protein [Atribacterota bacterium]|nr:uroporphyrinogen decarboxylase family protein [Atribacterota bacterium]